MVPSTILEASMAALSGVFEHLPPLGFVWQLIKPPSPAEEKEEDEFQLLHRSKVPPVYREPFILDGYRKTDTTFTYAFKAIFRWNNDVGNFWTHFIPFCIFFLWLPVEWTLRTDFTDPYFYPFACFWVGACAYSLFSSVAHLFGCVSFKVRSICFFFDYLGIALYTLGGGMVAYFYHLPQNSVLYQYKYPLLAYEVLLAVTATLVTGLSRFYWRRYRFVIRVLAFLLPYINTASPIGVRILTVCLPTGKECVMETLFHHIICEILTLVLTFFFISKIPERFAPGKFDYVFQSHQVFHVTAAVQTVLIFYMIPIETAVRREGLSKYEVIKPDLFTTFAMYGAAIVGCLVVVLTLSVLVMKEVLKPNKSDIKTD